MEMGGGVLFCLKSDLFRSGLPPEIVTNKHCDLVNTHSSTITFILNSVDLSVLYKVISNQRRDTNVHIRI